MKDKSNARLFNAELARRLGLLEAIVLQQVFYWTLRSNHEQDGRRWTYHTLEEWEAEFPFVSRSTIRRTLTGLRDKGYLLTGTFNKWKNDRTTWYAVDAEKIGAEFFYGKAESASEWPDLSAQNEQGGVSKMSSALPKNTKDHYKEVKPAGEVSPAEESGAQQSAPDNQEGEAMALVGGSKSPSKGASPSSLKEAVQSARKPFTHDQIVSILSAKPITAAVMGNGWRLFIRKHHPDIGFVPELTKKQLGQLSQFYKKVGKDRAVAVMGRAVRDWVKYVKFAQSMTGKSWAPASPNLDFLVAHAAEAVNFAGQAMQLTAPESKVKSKLADSIGDSQLGTAPAPEDKEASMTLDELMAFEQEGGA